MLYTPHYLYLPVRQMIFPIPGKQPWKYSSGFTCMKVIAGLTLFYFLSIFYILSEYKKMNQLMGTNLGESSTSAIKSHMSVGDENVKQEIIHITRSFTCRCVNK